MASDLGLHLLPVSHLLDAMYEWVNTKTILNGNIDMFSAVSLIKIRPYIFIHFSSIKSNVKRSRQVGYKAETKNKCL